MLEESLRNYGAGRSLLVDKNGVVIAGNKTLEAAVSVGLDDVVVVPTDGTKLVVVQRTDLDLSADPRAKALGVADNRVAQIGLEWDANVLQELVVDGADLGAMFTDKELAELVSTQFKAKDGLTDPDEVPDAPVDPVSKLGDVWVCGPHRVMCGSSLEQTAVDKLCASQAVDMLLTDPPYNVAYTGKTKEALTIKNDSMDDESFRGFLRDAFVSADTVMKPGAVFYIWHADLEGYNFRGACRDANWKVRQCLVWRKNSMVMGRQDYHWQHEPCLYGWKEGASHLWASDRKQTTILDFDRPSRSENHPTMKPVALFEYQLLNNTKCGDIVLDSFGGSGTTLIAAEKNGRVARLMELDPKYVDVIVQRWEAFTGKKAERVTASAGN